MAIENEDQIELVCYIEKYETSNGQKTSLYNVGCKPLNFCSSSGPVLPVIGKRSASKRIDRTTCHECCSDKDICNLEGHCGSKSVTLPVGSTICYSCPLAMDPNKCNHIALCDSACSLKQTRNLIGQPRWTHGCSEKSQCATIAQSNPQGVCSFCCDTELCNHNCTIKSTIAPPTTTTTMAPTIHIAPCKVRLNDNPVLSIPYINQDGDVKFNCTFRSSTSRIDVVYKVSWTVDGHPLKNRNGIDEVTLLSSYEHVAILDAYNLNGNLNKMLRCKVEPQCSIGDPLPGSHSNGYWVGIKVSPQRISHTVEQNITLVSTLPVISSDGLHKLYVGPQIESTGQNLTACKYPFEWDPFTRKYISTIPVLSILPHSFYKTSDKLFFRQLKDLNFPIFRNYNLPIVQIGSYDARHDVSHRCELKEGHVNVFDNSTLDASAYSYLELYQTNSTPTIEVQVKRQPCGNKNCSCAIIVREGNDAVQIDTCGQTTSIIPEVTYLSNTSEKHMSMQQTDDGLFFLVTVLSGSNITVNLTGSDPDMHVVLSILDQDKNPPGGICGNETWLYIPGIGNVASNGQKEPEFLKAWTLPQNASMFKTGISFDQNNSITDIGYCKCEGPKISCGTII
ncbi:Hypothetical predicted protein [Mytilus galloprovincialis]|uniref:VWFD domain-containing protein n=1 Tax=Mytilus galloprovincialis TaxID=29158 RepID=A0A8B6H1M2_MYTGA|nr:Hypothetical predicted protein [Mytilus galloprovincialis]